MNHTYRDIPAKELIQLLQNADWMRALHDEFKKEYFIRLFYFLSMEDRQGKNILPPIEDVFHAFSLTPLSDVKVVILGQDPYPTRGDGHGLAFSVRRGVKIPRSLNNIYAELKSELMSELMSGTLKLPSGCEDADSFFTDGNLEHWLRQGVLLLNTVLTVNEGESNSHQRRGWEQFTDAAINALVSRDRPLVFLLWGANAQRKKELIHSCMSPAERICILESAHPSPLSAARGFFGSAPFSKANAFLTKHGLSRMSGSPRSAAQKKKSYEQRVHRTSYSGRRG